MKVSKLLKIVDSIVPLKNAFEDDLVGLTIGSEENDVNGIIIAHELDKQLLDHCLNSNINTVISYHPPSFNKVLGDDNTESFDPEPTTSEFIDSSINVITLHTAQDVCEGGNGDTLAKLFNLQNVKLFAMTNDKFGAGRIGDIETISISKFNDYVQDKLNTKSIRTNEFFHKLKEIKRIAILPGSGTQFIDEIINTVDVYITGDISHRYLLKADDAGLGLLQIGHISSEIPGMKKFVVKLNNVLNEELEYVYREYYE